MIKHLVPYIAVGKQKRELFEETLDEFYDDRDRHMYIRGQPGVGKTFLVLKKADDRNEILCHIEGSVTKWLFTKKLAVYLYKAGWPRNDDTTFDTGTLPNVTVYIDDCPTVFDNDFIGMLKIALESNSSDKLTYNASLGGQYKQAEPMEKEAIDNFKVIGEAGFTMPFYNKVKFIFTMNAGLANDLDVQEAQLQKKSHNTIGKLLDQSALHSRVDYKDLHMTKEEYWGWIADLMLNENILEHASNEDIWEMLEWMYNNWEKLKDKSVRMAKEKLWKPMAKSKTNPNYDYKSRWYELINK
jgi:hypothetical protein